MDYNRLANHLFRSFFSEKMGRKKKMPTSDMSRPPMVPAAKGNQKASTVPIRKGMKPKMVETTLRKMGMILVFHALV